MTRANEPRARGNTELMPYWDRVAATYAAADPLGAVCYPGAPRWFNRFFERSQQRAVAHGLRDVALAGKHALDVGCGSGRWSAWLADRGAIVTGIDPSAAMLQAARKRAPAISFQQMSITAPDLAPGSFEVLLAVTVVQHLRPDEQADAVASMARLLRPGGVLLALDVIDQRDRGRIVFARSAQGWIELYQRHGFLIREWSGQEFVPLLRPLTALAARRGAARVGDADVTMPTMLEAASRRRVPFWVLWPVIQLSYVLERPCEAWLPRGWARHGCFLFERSGAVG